MEFIQLYGAQSLPQADKERIYQDTQGNAFLLTQLIGSIMENGRPTVLPRNMEEILSYRLSGLTDEGLQVLNLVAMFPDRAPYPVLERVSSKPTLDLLYVCQELCRRSPASRAILSRWAGELALGAGEKPAAPPRKSKAVKV